MSKRKIILLIIILVIITTITFVFLYFLKPISNTTIVTSGTNFLSEFFPFGKSNTAPSGGEVSPVDISGYIPPTNTQNQKELLTKVSTMPIAGYGVFMKERFKEENEVLPAEIPTPDLPLKKGEVKNLIAPTTEFIPNLRYVERATGNIYQTYADSINEQKFTTTIIPQVYDAYFGEKGESVVMRFLKPNGKTIQTFAGTLPKEILGGDTSSELSEISGSFLPENITDISVSPTGSSIFYVFNIENSAIGVTATPYGDQKNQIFNSPFTEWLSQWPNERMITLNTKPSFGTPGFVYYLDPSIKKLNKILGDINGLTTLTSPSGKLILYNNNSLSLRVYNTDTEESLSVGVRTMPEKCVWDKTNTNLYCAVPKYISGTNYPDVWYQGEISFSDELWKINTENGSTTKIADPTSFTIGEEIDGIKLSLDESENYLFFVNKKDSYLWELNLK